MFYSIFLIFFALQKYYLMICSCTFTHMATERNVWKMRRTCMHLRLHHDPYVSRSQRKEKQVPDRCSILTSTWTQPDGLYVRFSFTTGASQEATQAVSTTWDLRFISRDAKRDESKLVGKKLAPHALDLPSKVPDVQAQRQSEQRHMDQNEMGSKKAWQVDVGHPTAGGSKVLRQSWKMGSDTGSPER